MRRLVCLTIAVLVSATAATAQAGDWLRYGGDDQVTNFVPGSAAAPLGASTASFLRQRWFAQLDGAIVASPLYVQRLGLVYVATEGGSVYALRAADGSVVWHRELGSVDVADCGPFGISSTGVIDPQASRLYVIGASGLLHALDLSTGDEADGWPVELITRTTVEHVWGGLTLVAGAVYVPIASYCDNTDEAGFADGRLVGIDTASSALVAGWDIVPGPSNMGGIWGYGGVSVDPLTGDFWAATGNGATYDPSCDCIVETALDGEEVVDLSPTLNPVATSRPAGIPNAATDTDFGSTPLLFQPPGCPALAAAHSKNGYLYVWRRDALAAGPIFQAQIGSDGLDSPFIGEPSYSPELQMLYVADARTYAGDGTVDIPEAVAAFSIGADCAISAQPTWVTAAGVGPKPPALVVGDVVFVSGGVSTGVWALSARTGAQLWSSFLGASVYSPPAWAGDEAIFGTAAGGVYAFGLPATIGLRPVAHAQLPAPRLATASPL